MMNSDNPYTAVFLELAWLRKKLRKDQKPLANRIDVIAAIMKQTMSTIKRIQGELRPWMLDNLGLCSTMEWQAENFSEHTKIPVALNCMCDTITDQRKMVAIFRVFQEALTNVARHSGASEVRVELRQYNHEVLLTVSDNGRGVDKHEIRKPLSFGLLGMKERVEAFGGSLTIEGSPGKGTTLQVRIPHEAS